MTDCFIMIHVIIFFVGVTNMLSGTVPCGLAGGSTGAAGVGIQRSALFRGENLCSEGVCRVCWACVIESLCTNSRWLWVGYSYLYGREPLPRHGWARPCCENCHSSDPGGSHTASLPQQKQLRNWAIIHIQVPAICKYRAWGVHSAFLQWADLGFQLK